MADIHGSPGAAPQMPQVAGPGSAPVPYAGADQSPEPPRYGVDLGALVDAGSEVLNGIPSMPGLSESAAAHDIAAGLADAPYHPGDLSPIYAGGDADAGGRDDVAGTVAASVDAATARWREFQSDTFGQGSVIGDLMTLPHSPMNPAVGVQDEQPPFEVPFFPETNQET